MNSVSDFNALSNVAPEILGVKDQERMRKIKVKAGARGILTP